MSGHVRLEVALVGKLLFANRTSVWFFTGMDFHVYFTVAFCCQNLPTHLTRVSITSISWLTWKKDENHRQLIWIQIIKQCCRFLSVLFNWSLHETYKLYANYMLILSTVCWNIIYQQWGYLLQIAWKGSL